MLSTQKKTYSEPSKVRSKADPTLNRLGVADRAAHSWYRFVLSFPPHLVREYVENFGLREGSTLLDPFCGTGTTVVEAKKLGIRGIGLEANPMAAFAGQTKLDWKLSPNVLRSLAEEVRDTALTQLERDGIPDGDPLEAMRSSRHRSVVLRTLEPAAMDLLLANSISPNPLHKVLVLLEAIDLFKGRRGYEHARLALARSVVETSSNLHFGPEVGVSPPKADAPVVDPWFAGVMEMATHLQELKPQSHVESIVYFGDSRDAGKFLRPASIDAVFTSPPYPNEKDYTRTTRLESVLLGFLRDMDELRSFKKGLIRSNTRTAYKSDTDDLFVAKHAEIQRIAAEIERRRIEMSKTSGFEKMYHRVTKLYFGGMARHLSEIRPALKPGAMLGYVVGDQASYLRVMIRTGELLADLAKGLGYEVVRIDLFRTRLATATKEQLREETVVLRWPGK
ncbi:MAG: DNA methyltransferase [Phycisphaerales bacterium]